MVLNLKNFDFQQVKAGSKVIEIRAGSKTKNYSNLIQGNIVTFLNEETQEKCNKIITTVKYYKTAEELFNSEDWQKINPHLNSKKDALSKLFNIPNYKEKINSLGIWAIRIE